MLYFMTAEGYGHDNQTVTDVLDRAAKNASRTSAEHWRNSIMECDACAHVTEYYHHVMDILITVQHMLRPLEAVEGTGAELELKK